MSKEHNNPIHLKIRVVKLRGAATAQEIADVVREASITGREPSGWRIYAVNWEHPNTGARGSVRDMTAFQALVDYHADELQISPVKRTR